ncbi:biotin carboxylase 2-like isoform X2 [Oscarella lobularis]|uniref:biotin carboxylase 2-like isoform X2 n=1 Tax=Oscarella lobularis TaxID=121494 RepID=UPI0033142415
MATRIGFCTLSGRFWTRNVYARRLSNDQSLGKKSLDTILVANRGEIACRVLKTARLLGIRTVAVFSDADRNSLHTKKADEAYYIGASESEKSYLNIDKIIEVAIKSDAKAIHPGYGFLSERAAFAEECQRAGIVFIGPPASAIRSMGDKKEAKMLMTAAGVPLVSGYHGDDQSNAKLREEAEKIGFPVMLKAVLGGGGKGMRIVRNLSEFDDQLESARREAKQSFGDDRMLVEKYVEKPRHVEIQVFADTLGNTVYLYERDCSVQRRHQKIIEEAPAPGLDDQVRRELGLAAVRAAKAVGYVGAGTVEFIMDVDKKFYFMEMNTRLQVEHPVTEMITGTDLVEWQIKVASGEALPLTQEDIPLLGHSFEARIYAENPSNNFLPDPGRLLHLSAPHQEVNVRVDTGVEQGDEISMFYDPMIAKLVVWDQNRTSALNRLAEALRDYHIVGVNTNTEFLINLAKQPSFVAGDVHTGFIDQHEKSLFPEAPPLSQAVLAQTALSLVLRQEEIKDKMRIGSMQDPFGLSTGFRSVPISYFIDLSSDNQTVLARITKKSDSKYSLTLVSGDNQDEVDVDLSHCSIEKDAIALSGILNDESFQCKAVFVGDSLHLFHQDGRYKHEMIPSFARETKGSADASKDLSFDAFGTVVEVYCAENDNVKKGDILVAIESMKQEHRIVAPYDGTVTEIFYKQKDQFSPGSPLLAMEPTQQSR